LPLLGIDKETYLGVIFQNAADQRFRLPKSVRPSEFFDKIDPTPGEPGMNRTIRMPGYPRGSIFMLDGLMASTPGMAVAEQLNGMSAWQNTLAPPPTQASSVPEALKHGADIFNRAGCVSCHSGRYFTNHDVIPQKEIGTQPSRAKALAAFPRIFASPQTYPNSVSVPVPPDPPVLPIPIDITPKKVQEVAYAKGHPAGGYKVSSLIELNVSAPYLHDGGVAASSESLKQDKESFNVANPSQLGMAGTLLQGIQPDPSAIAIDKTVRTLNIRHAPLHLAGNQTDSIFCGCWSWLKSRIAQSG